MKHLKDKIRGILRARVANRRARRPAVKTPFGFMLNAPALMQDGTFEQEETKLVRAILDRSTCFVNAGANVGYYCCIAQMHGVKTIAFEPIQNNADLLKKNIHQNGWGENISIIPVAVGEKSGVAEMFGDGTGASLIKGWARNPESLMSYVSIVRMDDIVQPPEYTENMFVLMDVEGFESFALKGAEKLINAPFKPVWLIEINLTELQPTGVSINPNGAETFKIMKDAGYAVYDAYTGTRHIPWEEIEAATRPDGKGFERHNFIFLDAERDIGEFTGAL